MGDWQCWKTSLIHIRLIHLFFLKARPNEEDNKPYPNPALEHFLQIRFHLLSFFLWAPRWIWSVLNVIFLTHSWCLVPTRPKMFKLFLDSHQKVKELVQLFEDPLLLIRTVWVSLVQNKRLILETKPGFPYGLDLLLKPFCYRTFK